MIRARGTGLPRRRRRVLIVVENLPVPFDRRVWQEACTLRDADYDVSVICPTAAHATARFERLEGIDVHRHPLPGEGNGLLGYLAEYGAALWWEWLLAWKVFRRTRFDVIHACNPPDLIWLVAAPFHWLFGTKFVFDHHDLSPELYEAKFGRQGAVCRMLQLLERCTFRLADISIATNQSYRSVATTRGGMDPRRVFVVRSGPSRARLRDVPPVPSLRAGRCFLAAYVGVMGGQEGLDLLLGAVRHIVYRRQRTDVQFVLVGDGPEAPRLRTLARDHDVAEFVTFPGRVSDDELLQIVCTADVCVASDPWNPLNDRSTMNKTLEYMALGKPIVQFDLTEGRVSAGAAALYAKPNDVTDFGDKVLLLLDHPELRAEMGRIGRARIENEFEWKFEAPKLVSAYASLWAQ
jgi:glycosyltransferase involved in cell wall biosynthesis